MFVCVCVCLCSPILFFSLGSCLYSIAYTYCSYHKPTFQCVFIFQPPAFTGSKEYINTQTPYCLFLPLKTEGCEPPGASSCVRWETIDSSVCNSAVISLFSVLRFSFDDHGASLLFQVSFPHILPTGSACVSLTQPPRAYLSSVRCGIRCQLVFYHFPHQHGCCWSSYFQTESTILFCFFFFYFCLVPNLCNKRCLSSTKCPRLVLLCPAVTRWQKSNLMMQFGCNS